ncbi:acyl-CoA dehydrogenase [Mycobacterium paraense]|uniref:Acyl-[acyl-carrier-protein] dehydrogenase MbtN n=1 Tax=Mycobacterium paraense TaxID=767916 RepID=A0ABX3VRG2_9MYCO|nr:acyl-CoA dehydrogenase family protein [Mycobacterium paraense]ORW32879.1 acyl-CoA dehydrogenase [Mycobacterium paraense]ORW45105.1 acyl-CoA dehydrogenase [Mycobacterium paraense]
MTQHCSPWVDQQVADLKEMAARFFETEAAPNRERWERQKCVDRDFWLAAGRLGLLCASIPEEYGGGGGTVAHDFAIFEAHAASGETGFGNLVHSGIVARYLLAYGSEDQKQRWLPKMATGHYIGALAMSEPGAGSDVKALRTTAVRDGSQYVINGSKTFISNGSSADLIVVVAKTDPSTGAKGISLIVVETAGAKGFRVGRVLDKLGMKAQDTAEIFFDDVRVPGENLLGDEGAGFGYAMDQLAHERLLVAVNGLSVMERAVAETVAYTKQRYAFGTPLFSMQNTRFELADCTTIARVARTFIDDCIVKHVRGELDATTASMAKAWVTDMQCSVIDRCLQLFGGYGFMMEYPITRMYADSRAQRIYAGANEVMKELIARSL